MVFRFEERPNSRSSTSNPPAITMEYVASGSNDPAYVKAYAFAYTGAVVNTVQGTLYRQDIRIEPRGFKLFYVSVPYGPRSESKGGGPIEAGQWTWDFSTMGGTFHLSTSRETVGKYAAEGETAPDHKGSINVQPDKTVAGTEIIIPAMKLTVRYRHPLAVVTLPFMWSMQDLTGTVNSEKMFGRPAGEILFLGCEGSDGTDAEATVSYHFAREKNLQNTIIGGITVAEKQGQDLLWIEHKIAVDGATNKSVSVPKHIYVERVYEQVDLASALGFGG